MSGAQLALVLALSSIADVVLLQEMSCLESRALKSCLESRARSVLLLVTPGSPHSSLEPKLSKERTESAEENSPDVSTESEEDCLWTIGREFPTGRALRAASRGDVENGEATLERCIGFGGPSTDREGCTGMPVRLVRRGCCGGCSFIQLRFGIERFDSLGSRRCGCCGNDESMFC